MYLSDTLLPERIMHEGFHLICLLHTEREPDKTRQAHPEDDPIDDCEAALNDKQPLPAAQARHAVHVEQASSQGRANDLSQ